MRRLPPNLHSLEHGGVAPPRVTLTAPAKALFALIRSPLGYETLSPVRATVRALLLLVMPPAFWLLMGLLTHRAPPENEGREVIYGYDAMVFAATLLRFLQRAIGQNRGEEIHTNEAGYCFVTRILFFIQPAVSEQLIVPGVIGWLGWQVAQSISLDLGVWLMICAGSYMLVANWEFRNRLAQRRAPVDDKIRANLFSSHVDTHEEKVKVAKHRKQKGRGKAPPLYAAGSEPDVAEFGGGKRRV